MKETTQILLFIIWRLVYIKNIGKTKIRRTKNYTTNKINKRLRKTRSNRKEKKKGKIEGKK